MSLDLVVALSHNSGVAGWRGAVAATLAAVSMLLLLARVAGGAVAEVVVVLLGLGLALVRAGLLLGLTSVAVDEDVGHAAALAVMLREGVVFAGGLGVLDNDVPGVDEAGDEAEDAEENVDDGVC